MTDNILYWFVTVDRNIKNIKLSNVESCVEYCLSHPQGWMKFGYKFQQVPTKVGLLNIDNPDINIVHIRVANKTTIQDACDYGELSCTQIDNHILYVNASRWNYGSKQSGLSIEEYRMYVIFHEIGHILGKLDIDNLHDFQHSSDCPIMYQQSISNGSCFPNIFPLDFE